MPKYFFKPDKPLSIGSGVVLESDTAFHLINVLRVKPGDELTLCDGNNTDFIAAVAPFSKKTKLTLLVKDITPCTTEPTTKITLYQALPKGDKLDLIIQKTVELGVTEIIPVVTSRSVVKIKDSAKKTERYQRIAESAAGQSMRGIIPKVHEPVNFKDASIESATFVAYEGEKNLLLKSAMRPYDKINIWIGPEGGFAPEEILALTERGAIPISLGQRILRTETAAIAAVAQAICLLEG